jgi:5-methyltetrahydropteroyltriglutamate--homocysteine methyltransferase
MAVESSLNNCRVDQVGSLLRPQGLKDAYARQGKGEASNETDPALQYWRTIVERLRLADNRPLAEWRFASGLTKNPVKVTLIATDRIGENFARQNSRGVYAGLEEYRADVIGIEHRIVNELAQAGCPYIQLDAPSYTAYVDTHSLERMRSAGIDPIRQMEQSIKADNAVIEGISGVTFGIHLCRGNVRSMWPSPRSAAFHRISSVT